MTLPSATMDYLQRDLDSLKFSTGKTIEASEGKKEKTEQFLDELTLEGVANYIKSGRCECVCNCVCMFVEIIKHECHCQVFILVFNP